MTDLEFYKGLTQFALDTCRRYSYDDESAYLEVQALLPIESNLPHLYLNFEIASRISMYSLRCLETDVENFVKESGRGWLETIDISSKNNRIYLRAKILQKVQR